MTIESTEDSFLKKEEKLQLILLIQELDEITKEIVTLRVYGELSFKEIGELVEKTENYARITFHRAKLKMQKELSSDEG
ncbi:sigma factor-like helix-turn-helix DNA-binding protein [Anaerobacillus sp. CMMVII]|uniref:sigma factor-like helix-turn-helix DNA-binding protein n=1 Tax=Anaerobacillus sp. CMMVII TaxID=2755588 RepID=UPI0021B84783|nr:sigma factor-like helix-turn-helix DNA-binding protein [Anaerobacillus sp. CMMVII]